jgi:hypothetical protein
MQNTLIAGDTLRFDTEVPDYPATSGYTLSYRLFARTGAGGAIDITASANGAGYRVNVLPVTTASWEPGRYSWSSYVTDGTDRFVIERGEIEILADPVAGSDSYDTRTHARRVLDAIEAVLEKRASVDQMELSVEFSGQVRQLKRTPLQDLIALRSKYLMYVADEEAAERMRNGLGSRRRVMARFG